MATRLSQPAKERATPSDSPSPPWAAPGPDHRERSIPRSPALVADAVAEARLAHDLGAGVLPLHECVDLVVRDGHAEWISWKDERAWHPQVPPLTEIGAAGRAWLREAVG